MNPQTAKSKAGFVIFQGQGAAAIRTIQQGCLSRGGWPLENVKVATQPIGITRIELCHKETVARERGRLASNVR